MKALVINLDSAKDRMDFQSQQLNQLDIGYQRISAFVINNSRDNIYQKYFSTWQRPLSVSEVSCFFSHKKAWDQVIEENQAMLILEDDALLSQNVACILEELSTLDNLDYVNLEERKNRKKLLSTINESEFCGTSLIRLYQGRSGAAGYVLWPSGAKKLLQQMDKNGIGIADKFINENYSLQAYQIEPACIIQLDQCQQHDIESPLKVRSSIKPHSEPTTNENKWVFKLRRIMGELKIGLNQIRHFHHAKRRTIKVSDQFVQAKRNK